MKGSIPLVLAASLVLTAGCRGDDPRAIADLDGPAPIMVRTADEPTPASPTASLLPIPGPTTATTSSSIVPSSTDPEATASTATRATSSSSSSAASLGGAPPSGPTTAPATTTTTGSTASTTSTTSSSSTPPSSSTPTSFSSSTSSTSTPRPGGGGGGEASLVEAEGESLRLLNELRAGLGRQLVAADDAEMHAFARQWALEMRTNGFRHSSARWYENIVWYSDETMTPAEAAAQFHRMWVDSPGHYANMTNPDWSVVGIGMWHDETGWWGVHVFR